MSETQEQATKTRAPRTKVFGRTYDHTTSTLALEVAGQPEATIKVQLASLPQNVRDAFALMALADFAVSAGNAMIREGGKPEDGIKAINEAIEKASKGELEFSSGMGLGMTSAPATMLVGRALVEEGKTFAAWGGVRYDFAGDVEKAQAAMRALYEDKEEREVPDGPGKTKKMTGRQFYNQIASLPAIAKRVEGYKKQRTVVVADDLLG